jgi:hypothetical protein
VLLVTLTAPSDVDQHCSVHRKCDARQGEDCRSCPCTPAGGVNLGKWNGECAARFNRFMQDLRRMLRLQVQYFKGAEVQQRGALHFHVLVRLPASIGCKVNRSALRALAMHHGFGHSIDVQAVDDHRAAGYVAKYVSKSCTERDEMPWVHRRTGEVVRGHGRYRVWTASRRWGVTMGEVRAAQAAWWAQGGPTGATGAAPQGPAPTAPKAPLDPSSQSYTTASQGSSSGAV